MPILHSIKKIDWFLFFLVAILGIGAMIAFAGIGERSGYIIQRYALLMVIGTVAMVVIACFDYRIFKNYPFPSLAVYVVSVLLLLPVLASRQIRGINAWLTFFDTYQFQPSEFAKIAVLLVLAKYFSQKHAEIYRVPHIIASGFYALIPAGLTLLQPDLGSASIFIFLWLAMLLFSGIKRRHLLVIVIGAGVAFLIAWLFVFKPYQKNRIIAFINPYADARGIGYNTIQSQTTLGSGRWLGTVMDGKDSKLSVLVPEPYTDFAFAAFGQKFGFVGILGFAVVFSLIFWRIGAIAYRVNNNFAKLYTLGFMVVIFAHLAINAGMNLGLLPITGIPLTFLSYGGSHFVTMMVGLGLVQSIRVYS